MSIWRAIFLAIIFVRTGNLAAQTPQIKSLEPNTAEVGDDGLTIEAKGSSFDRSAVVYFDSVAPHTPTNITRDSLTFRLSAADTASRRVVSVTITTLGGTSKPIRFQ